MLQRILTRLTGLAACIAVTMTSASGQSLFDEMILDGETVSASADTTTVKPVVKETRSTRQGRQRRNPRKQMEKVPSLTYRSHSSISTATMEVRVTVLYKMG